MSSFSFYIFVALLYVHSTFGILQGVCYLEPVGGKEVFGKILFHQASTISNVSVTVNINQITVLKDGQLGIHIHEFGNITDKERASAAGGHLIGNGAEVHACPPNDERHQGDLGNWNVQNGIISQTQTLDLLTLFGDDSIIGRSLILHDHFDECTGQNLGSRIGQCVIGIDDISYNLASTTFPDVLVGNAFLSSPDCQNCQAKIWLGSDQSSSAIRVIVAVRGLALTSPNPIIFDDTHGSYEPQTFFSTNLPADQFSWYEFILEPALIQHIGKTITLQGIACSETGDPDQSLSISGIVGVGGLSWPEIPRDENQQLLKGWKDSLCFDVDGDNYSTMDDCDDTNPRINPGMNETCYNSIDENCNGEIDEGCILPVYGTELALGQPHTGSILNQQWDTFYLDAFGDVAVEIKVLKGRVCAYVNQGSPPGSFPSTYQYSSCGSPGSEIDIFANYQSASLSLGPFWFVGIKSDSETSEYSVVYRWYLNTSSASSLPRISFTLLLLISFVMYSMYTY